jgi:hypothetical protein
MADGLSTGVGLSTAFSGKLDRFYQIAQTNAARLAAAKAAADKRAAEDDAKSFAKYKDLAVIDPTKYTPKYLPIAQRATLDLVNGLVEAKRADPNNWTNNAPQLIAAFNEKANFAYNQSETQRGLEKLGQEYNIPEKLKAAYNSNYGDVSDIANLSQDLADYGIIVDQSGAVSGQPYKRFDLNANLKAITSNEDLYIPKENISYDKSGKSVVNMTLTMKPDVFANTKNAAYSSPEFISSVRTNPSDRAVINQRKNQLLTSNPNMNPQEADLRATYSVIDDKLAPIEKITKVNVGGGRPGASVTNIYTSPQTVTPNAGLGGGTGYTKQSIQPKVTDFTKPGSPLKPIYDAIKKQAGDTDKVTNVVTRTYETKDPQGKDVMYRLVTYPATNNKAGYENIYRIETSKRGMLSLVNQWKKQGNKIDELQNAVILNPADELYDANDLTKISASEMVNREYSPSTVVHTTINGKDGYYMLYNSNVPVEDVEGNETKSFYKLIEAGDTQEAFVKTIYDIKNEKTLDEIFEEQGGGGGMKVAPTTKATKAPAAKGKVGKPKGNDLN